MTLEEKVAVMHEYESGKDKYRWHDLKKHPDDLPEEGMIITFVSNIGEPFTGTVIELNGNLMVETDLFDYGEYGTCSYRYFTSVRAWRIFEPFASEGKP